MDTIVAKGVATKGGHAYWITAADLQGRDIAAHLVVAQLWDCIANFNASIGAGVTVTRDRVTTDNHFILHILQVQALPTSEDIVADLTRLYPQQGDTCTAIVVQGVLADAECAKEKIVGIRINTIIVIAEGTTFDGDVRTRIRRKLNTSIIVVLNRTILCSQVVVDGECRVGITNTNVL